MSGWASGDVDVDRVRLHYHRTGGDGPPLVLLHGFSDAGLCWTRVARDLESDYDVVMPDARGHGRSERAGGEREAGSLAADAAGLIRALDLDRVALMGHSMGAATAAEVAGADPDLVACLVLEDPPWRDQTEVVPGRWDYLRHAQQLPPEDLSAYCRQLHPTWDEAEVGPWVEAKRQFDLSLVDGPRGAPRPWREIAAAIHSPMLLLTADTDLGGIVTPEAGVEAARLAGGRVEHIGGAGHNIRRERYQDYRAAVKNFLQHVYPAGVRAEEAP
jgi:pimeloyl-ACP methyl ester carboxylesterase